MIWIVLPVITHNVSSCAIKTICAIILGHDAIHMPVSLNTAPVFKSLQAQRYWRHLLYSKGYHDLLASLLIYVSLNTVKKRIKSLIQYVLGKNSLTDSDTSFVKNLISWERISLKTGRCGHSVFQKAKLCIKGKTSIIVVNTV